MNRRVSDLGGYVASPVASGTPPLARTTDREGTNAGQTVALRGHTGRPPVSFGRALVPSARTRCWSRLGQAYQVVGARAVLPHRERDPSDGRAVAHQPGREVASAHGSRWYEAQWSRLLVLAWATMHAHGWR